MKNESSLLQNIENAELLLVGIGKEFAYSLHDFDCELEKLFFEDKIKEQEFSSFYHDVLQKRWMRENPDSLLIKAYQNLGKLSQNKNFYIVSLCYDDMIYDSEIDQKRIVTPCGGFSRIQRSIDGKREILSISDTEEMEETVLQAFDRQDFRLLELFEQTYHGQKLAYNCILSEEYDEMGYLEAWKSYLRWLQGTVNRNVCVLELGVDMQFPSVIRWPFEKVVMYNQKALFYRVHEWLFQIPVGLEERAMGIKNNSVDFLGKLFV